nr:hypothetical protein [Neobacillus sp. Marseille-Q6967]
MDYNQYWSKIYETNEKLNSLVTDYWHHYSSLGTWQFWVVLGLFIIPLIIVYFSVDRSRIFEIFFYGYTVHILWANVEIIFGNKSLFIHTYFLSSYLPNPLSMTASVLPVSYLLLYQYCINHQKNFYLYSIFLSALYAFVFAPLEEYIGLLDIRKGMNLFYLFLIDVAIAYTAYWFTRFILKLRNQSQTSNEKG